MPSELLVHYERLIEGGMSGCAVAMCWTVVQPATLEDVVVRLGGDPDELAVLDLDEAYTVRDGWVLHLDQVGAAVTVFENNGYQGSRARVLEALSAGARVHSAYWNVELDNRLSIAENGVVVAAVDGLAPADGFDELREARPFQAGMLAVVERLTGVRLDDAWFARDHEAIVIPRL